MKKRSSDGVFYSVRDTISTITTKQQLVEKLEALNLTIQSKIELWLTYRGLKPTSLISIRLEEKEKYKDILKDIKCLDLWIREAGLYGIQDKDQKESFYVSSDESKVKELSKIMWNEDRASVYRKGILFGYPKKAVKLYADNIELIDKGTKTFKKAGLIEGDNFLPFLAYDWHAYIRYIVRSENIDEDVNIALKWAQLCRKEIPLVAEQFESELELLYNRD